MLKALCIDNINPWYFDKKEKYPIEVGNLYDVDFIDMGRFYTSVYLCGVNQSINSVCLEFYEDGKDVDIYNDRRYNPYL